jgi:hypothetical protein
MYLHTTSFTGFEIAIESRYESGSKHSEHSFNEEIVLMTAEKTSLLRSLKLLPSGKDFRFLLNLLIIREYTDAQPTVTYQSKRPPTVAWVFFQPVQATDTTGRQPDADLVTS